MILLSRAGRILIDLTGDDDTPLIDARSDLSSVDPNSKINIQQEIIDLTRDDDFEDEFEIIEVTQGEEDEDDIFWLDQQGCIMQKRKPKFAFPDSTSILARHLMSEEHEIEEVWTESSRTISPSPTTPADDKDESHDSPLHQPNALDSFRRYLVFHYGEECMGEDWDE